ncbi:hypothetical protein [Pontibacter beigongshangensis]|uniref:hypothetical protein n=1 Tax=Pontibacter beigongshangensis TaxID=2574733 RepID=UPI0016503203|nr:hypothetical protein [Pontibacter beigongshangensis]
MRKRKYRTGKWLVFDKTEMEAGCASHAIVREVSNLVRQNEAQALRFCQLFK